MGTAGDLSTIANKVIAASVKGQDAAVLTVDDGKGSEDYAGGLYMCIVCFYADRSAILAPCGHVAMCRWVVNPMWPVIMHRALLVKWAM